MNGFLHLKIFFLVTFFLLASCTIPSSAEAVRDYGDIEIPPFLPPLPPILLTIDGLEDLYLGRNTKTAEYVAIELKKISKTSLAISMGEGTDFYQAIRRMSSVKNMEIYEDTIYEGHGLFRGMYLSTDPEWTFVMNPGWGSFEIYFRTDADATFTQLYRFNDPYNPHLDDSL